VNFRRCDNSWYPVYKRPWYPFDILDIRDICYILDIRLISLIPVISGISLISLISVIPLISLISDGGIRPNNGCFQRFFKFFTLWPVFTDKWQIIIFIQLIFLILCWNPRYFIEIWSIFSYTFIIPLIPVWYPWYPTIRCTDFEQVVIPWWISSYRG